MSAVAPPDNAALILVDLQQAIDHPSWGTRNNPDAEARCQKVLALWRTQNRTVIHIKHNSTDPDSHYRPERPTNAFKIEFTPAEGEMVFEKTTNSAFIGTDLTPWLRSNQIQALIFAGVITNNSLEATVRNAGNLGFDTWLLSDCCYTFGRKDLNGTYRTAEEIHEISLMNLHQEYCTVINSSVILTS